jgi:hypothetical protein
MELPKIITLEHTDQEGDNYVSTVSLFMIDEDVFDRITLGFMRGELNTVEARIGKASSTDKQESLKLATQSLKKEKLLISKINIESTDSEIYTDMYIIRRSLAAKLITSY